MSVEAELDDLVLEAMELGLLNLGQIERRVREMADLHVEAHGVAPEWWPATLARQWHALIQSINRQSAAGRVVIWHFPKTNRQILQLAAGVTS